MYNKFPSFLIPIGIGRSNEAGVVYFTSLYEKEKPDGR